MIYIIVVNWKRYGDTIECLESLTRLEGPDFRVVVVDNESDIDGLNTLREWVDGRFKAEVSGPPWKNILGKRAKVPECRIYNNGDMIDLQSAKFITVVAVTKNGGFAAANNIGIRAALNDPTCSYVWLLNNDTVVDKNALSALMERVRLDKRIGVCGSTLLYYDSPSIIQSLGGAYSSFLGRGKNLSMGTEFAQLPAIDIVEKKIDYVIGASMFISCEFVREVGLMEEKYFLYFEELDWSCRIRGRFRQGWAPNSIVYHKEGRSIGTNSRNRSSDLSLYYYNINYLRFTKRFYIHLFPFAIFNVLIKSLRFLIFGDFRGSATIARALGRFLLERK